MGMMDAVGVMGEVSNGVESVGKARPQSETGRGWYTKCAGDFNLVYRK